VIWAFAFGLGVVSVLWLTNAGASASDRRIAAVLAANFALYLVGQALSGSAAPWQWFLATDAICAWVILHPPASRTAAVVGGLYVLIIIVHLAYAVSGSTERLGLYLDILASVGWCQLLVLATGAIHGRRRKVGNVRSGSSAGAGFAPSHRSGLE
jgi:hypothetical protein